MRVCVHGVSTFLCSAQHFESTAKPHRFFFLSSTAVRACGAFSPLFSLSPSLFVFLSPPPSLSICLVVPCEDWKEVWEAEKIALRKKTLAPLTHLHLVERSKAVALPPPPHCFPFTSLAHSVECCSGRIGHSVPTETAFGRWVFSLLFVSSNLPVSA